MSRDSPHLELSQMASYRKAHDLKTEDCTAAGTLPQAYRTVDSDIWAFMF